MRTRSDALFFRCHSCGSIKAAADFAFSDEKRDTLSYACRKCHAAERRAHYVANKPTYIRQAIAQRLAHRELNRREVLSYLATHPCIDCGITNAVVLEFDHRDPSSKLTEVSRMISSKRWPRVMAEIEKCDVRCINCHRRKTARDFGWSKVAGSVE